MISDMEPQHVLSEGKALVAAGDEVTARLVAGQLVSVYETCSNDYETRHRAADLVAELTVDNPVLVDFLINSAKRYGEMQHLDDAFPNNPNSFDVLSKIGLGHPGIISFLRQTMENDWGIPRWQALDALRALRDPEADRILEDILKGKYPPRVLDIASDIRRIELARGADFIERHRGIF